MIRQVLGREGDFAPIDDAADDPDALRKIAQRQYDVVVLDLGLPGRSGQETVGEIRQRHPSLPVLILSAYPEKHFAVRALRAGANGYLMKSASSRRALVHAIRQVAGGGRYIGPEVAEILAAALYAGHDAQAPHEALSNREFEVMRAIATGKMVSEIARDLSLSVKTISTYRARALEKMSMRNNAQFTYYAMSEAAWSAEPETNASR